MSKGFFESIGAVIPGYSGYAERDGRRKTDKLLRMELVKILGRGKDNISALIRGNVKSTGLDNIRSLNNIKDDISRTMDKILYAQYGASGFFDVVQIDENRLDEIYLQDIKIQEVCIELVSFISDCKDTIENECENRIQNKIKRIEVLMIERERIIKEI